jgi:hypothetical protein
MRIPCLALLFSGVLAAQTSFFTATTASDEFDEEVIVLDPFCADYAESHQRYCGCGCGGRRSHGFSSGSVIDFSERFITDTNPLDLAELAGFAPLPIWADPVYASDGTAGFLGREIDTEIIAPAMVESARIGRYGIHQTGYRTRAPAHRNRSWLSLHADTRGYREARWRTDWVLHEQLDTGLRFQAQRGDGPQGGRQGLHASGSVALDANGRFRLYGQTDRVSLDNYGTSHGHSVRLNHDGSGVFFAEAQWDWHKLDRVDPAQFATMADGYAIQPGLSPFALGTLTAPIRWQEDQSAHISAGIDSGRYGRQLVVANLRTHRRTTAWDYDPNPQHRIDESITLSYNGRWWDERVEIGAHRRQPLESTDAPTETGVNLATYPHENWQIFADWRESASTPWLPAGPPSEQRSARQIGIGFTSWDATFSGMVAWLDQDVQNLTTRDWERSGVHYQTHRKSSRGGISVSASFSQPLPGFEVLFNGYFHVDGDTLLNRAPHQASLAARYVFNEDWVGGFAIGGTLATRTSASWSDGYTSPVATRVDLFVRYAFWRNYDHQSVLQLTLENLTDAAWAATRFEPERGRGARLSYTHPF